MAPSPSYQQTAGTVSSPVMEATLVHDVNLIDLDDDILNNQNQPTPTNVSESLPDWFGTTITEGGNSNADDRHRLPAWQATRRPSETTPATDAFTQADSNPFANMPLPGGWEERETAGMILYIVLVNIHLNVTYNARAPSLFR
jgi:hypothetical protein